MGFVAKDRRVVCDPVEKTGVRQDRFLFSRTVPTKQLMRTPPLFCVSYGATYPTKFLDFPSWRQNNIDCMSEYNTILTVWTIYSQLFKGREKEEMARQLCLPPEPQTILQSVTNTQT